MSLLRQESPGEADSDTAERSELLNCEETSSFKIEHNGLIRCIFKYEFLVEMDNAIIFNHIIIS